MTEINEEVQPYQKMNYKSMIIIIERGAAN